MLNPHEVSPAHLPAMQAAILKQRSKLDEHVVSKLYKTAKRVFREPSAMADLATDQTILPSRLCAGPITIGTCTDTNTGLFVQLSGPDGCSDDKLMLTFGTKYCQEVTDTIRGNRATKIW